MSISELMNDRAKAAARSKGSMARTVLVADDDAMVRDHLWRSLDELGFEVTEASNGREALDRLETAEFDLVILDYAMPGMSGPAAAQEIRRGRPGQPVLLISGYAETGTLRTASGEIRMLGKPFQLEELREAVEAALAA